MDIYDGLSQVTSSLDEIDDYGFSDVERDALYGVYAAVEDALKLLRKHSAKEPPHTHCTLCGKRAPNSGWSAPDGLCDGCVQEAEEVRRLMEKP